MLNTSLILIPAVIVIFVIVVALQPADFSIVRSATIAAPPAVVFAQVNEFRKWEAWSPWRKLGPAMRQTYEGPPSGPGAQYSWSGNAKVGQGRMTLEESRLPELIRVKLEFLKPFAATNATEFTFKEESGRARVTWAMSGKKVFATKACGLFMNMDKMVGGQFEEGLANLAKVVSART